MMATINPLGERARGNRWWRTALVFCVACAVGGFTLGAVAGTAGMLLAMVIAAPAGAFTVAACALALTAGMAELAAWPLPTVHRQVDDAWLGRYRGWVYATGFGVQLGAGLVTTVTTAAVHAMAGLAVVLGAAGEPQWALAMGLAFGLTRAAPVLAGWTLRDPARLRRRAARAAAAAPLSRLATGAGLFALAASAAVSL